MIFSQADPIQRARVRYILNSRYRGDDTLLLQRLAGSKLAAKSTTYADTQPFPHNHTNSNNNRNTNRYAYPDSYPDINGYDYGYAFTNQHIHRNT